MTSDAMRARLVEAIADHLFKLPGGWLGRGPRSVAQHIWLSVIGHQGGLRCTACFTSEARAVGIAVMLPQPVYIEESPDA